MLTRFREGPAALAGCVLLGIVAAVLSRPGSLLAGAQHGTATFENVWQAMLHAKRVNTEEAWLAAHREWLGRGDPERAAQCAFWKAVGLFFRGDLAPAMGWVARGGAWHPRWWSGGPLW